jgi:hypothetical protein
MGEGEVGAAADARMVEMTAGGWEELPWTALPWP